MPQAHEDEPGEGVEVALGQLKAQGGVEQLGLSAGGDHPGVGGLTAYKVKLDSGAVVRSSMANTVRLDIDAYHAGQRVVMWFTPDDCVVLEQ